MGKIILAGYSGWAICGLMVFVLSFSVLYKCHKDKNYGSTFWLSLALTGTWIQQFSNMTWWTVWKSRHLSNQTTLWMLDHSFVLWNICLIIFSGLLFIKVLTQDSKYGDIWKLCSIVVFGVIAIVWLTL